jgi:hypothetical protein
MCGRYRLSRRKQLVEEYFDSVSSDEDWSPRYNIAPTQHVPEGTRPGIVGDVLGADSVMGERRLRRDEDDQREGGNGRHEASVPRCVEIAQANRLLAPSWACWAETHCYVHLAVVGPGC